MKLKLLFILLLICGHAQAETPVVQWAKSFGGTSFDYSTSSAFDSKGNMYVIGYLWSPTVQIGTTFFHYTSEYAVGTAFVVKYDHTGNVLWAKGIEGRSIANGIAVDKSDNVFVCGVFYNDSITFGKQKLYNDYNFAGKLLLVKYDSSGNEIWAKSCVNADGHSNQGSSYGSICIDKAENIFVIGGFRGGIKVGNTVLKDQGAYDDLLIAKYNSNGDLIWAKSAGNKGPGFIVSSGIGVDLKSNIYITGSFTRQNMLFNDSLNVKPTSTQDIFIAKFDLDGNLLWTRSPQYDGDNMAETIAVDKSGNAYIGGMLGLYLTKYNTNGTLLWTKTVPKVEKSITGIYSICIDKKNNVYSTGFFNSTSITFDSITIANKGSAKSDIFIEKSDSLGNTIWAKSFGGGDFGESGRTISTDNNGNLLLTGFTESSNLTIGTNTFSSKGKTDVLVIKILLDSTHIYTTSKYCANDPILTLSAPANNSLYTWIDSNDKILGNSQSITIKNPVDSAVFTCKFKNSADSTIFNIFTLQKYDSRADFSSSLSDCKTNVVKFTNQSTTNQGSLEYVWDFGDGTTSTVENPIHNYTASGNHTVSLLITNKESGCTNSTSKVITYYPKPTISISGDTTLCNNETVLKSHGADAYVWSDGSTTDSIKVATGQKIWVLGYSASGCVSDTTFQLVQDLSPRPGISGSFKFCPGTSTVLHARGAYRYEWSDGTIADTMVVSKDTTIWMIAYSVAGCYTDTIKLHIKQLPGNDLTVEGSLNFCEGESTTLTASGAKYYSWSTGETTEKITVDKPGIYTVTGKNETYCSNTLSVNVQENPLPMVDFNLSDYIIDSRNNSVTVTAKGDNDVNYFWDMGDGTTETGPTILHYYNINNGQNEYSITLTGINPQGCSNTKTLKLNVEIFIPNIFSPNRDGINDIFMPGVNLEVFNRNGMTLYKGLSGWDGNYNGKEMPDDTYYYVVSYKDNKGQVQIKKGYIILKR